MLMELSEVYSLFLTDLAFYEKLLRFCIRRTLPFLETIASTGVDVVCMGGNVPGGFLGKKNYDRFVLPFEKEYVGNARRLGTLSLYHNCGEIMALAESYGEREADVVKPFAPPPLGDGDLAEAKRVSGGRYTTVGNVDQVNVLKKGGRFILQTADIERLR